MYTIYASNGYPAIEFVGKHFKSWEEATAALETSEVHWKDYYVDLEVIK